MGHRPRGGRERGRTNSGTGDQHAQRGTHSSTIGWEAGIPLCAEDPNHRGNMGRGPCAIQSFIRSTRERASNSAQRAPSSLTGLTTLTLSFSSHPGDSSSLSPGLRRSALTSACCSVPSSVRQCSMVGYTQGSMGGIYREGCIPTIPTRVVCTGIPTLPPWYHPGYTPLSSHAPRGIHLSHLMHPVVYPTLCHPVVYPTLCHPVVYTSPAPVVYTSPAPVVYPSSLHPWYTRPPCTPWLTVSQAPRG